MKLLIAGAHRYPDLARLWHRVVTRELVGAFAAKGLEVETRIFRDARPEAFDPVRFPGAVLDAPRPGARDFLEFYDGALELGHDFILFLDADVFILDGAWAAGYFDRFSEPDVAAVSYFYRLSRPGVYALLIRADPYRALPKPALVCSYTKPENWPNAVNHQPGDRANAAMRRSGRRIIEVPQAEMQRCVADFHGTTVVRASRELFGVFDGERFDQIGGDKRYFAMGAYDNVLLGALYRALYGEPFAPGPDGAHLGGSVTPESLCRNLWRAKNARLLTRLYTYFRRSDRALERLARSERIPVRPPRVFSPPQQLLLTLVAGALPPRLRRC